ncbi:hypothetical protein [Hyphomicrobium sp.]|uniref:hypothetical protein n=1 Tax=Hyphomicrobium sp. TaxID=82 RepID=UPI001DE39FA0|nr:hypothetical protein [Hyphomicrobium sp.]MBY0561495.1 hypothetical protein [Hyphomicrobium sp.]
MKILSNDELLEIMQQLDIDGYDKCLAIIERVGQVMAKRIAAKLGVGHGVTDFQGAAVAGTCTPFWPLTKEQEKNIPWPLADYDEGGEWEMLDEEALQRMRAYEPRRDGDYRRSDPPEN